MLVCVGFTVIVEFVCPPGLHKYVPPVKLGVVLKVTFSPLQIVEFEAVMAGIGLTVTVTVELAVQLFNV